MLDLREVRANPDRLRQSQVARGESPDVVDKLLAADETRRAALTAFESARAEQKSLSRKIGKTQQDERQALLQQAQELAAVVKKTEAEADDAKAELERLTLVPGNYVEDGVPAGGEDDYVVLKEVGDKPGIANPKDHLELAEGLNAIDMARGAKVSGARFYFLTGVGAELELAILNLAINRAISNGFTPVIPPTMVRPEIMGGTGYLGAHAEEVYRLERDDMYLVGTSEVALAGYHSDEIIDLSDGPKRYIGWSACYRREAGSHGRDTRGIIRVHQFHKVEMFSYCREEDAKDEHQRLLGWEEDMLAAMELPYRVIDTAAGDLGSSAARKFDCEAWLPSQERFMEVTSTSNCTTFQSRRLAIRERTDNGTRHVSTLNGTLGTTRWIVALLENHQEADGSVYVPEALRPYLGGRSVLEPIGSSAAR